MERKGVILLGNMGKAGVREQIDQLRPWFDEHVDIRAVLGADADICLPAHLEDVALAIVFGGDGTLLASGRVVAHLDIPLLGVNMGKLGFLADYNVEHLKKHLPEILDGRIRPLERMMLHVSVNNCEHHRFSSPAANDVSISAGRPFRMIDLLVDQGESTIAQYLGDGVIVSTPTGSTGYNLSAGGPILVPDLDAVAITPIAAHTLSIRPIVASAGEPIRITASSVNEGTTVLIDGQVPSGLCDGDTVEVRRFDHPLKIVPHPGRSFFRTLAGKLNWGLSPHHPRSS
jgi:NAD+ kinase